MTVNFATIIPALYGILKMDNILYTHIFGNFTKRKFTSDTIQ